MKNINIIFKREFSTYFNTPIGYIFSAFFLLLISFLFFFGLGGNSFWDMKVASMEQYFLWVPVLFIIFIPAVTMRLWSEEERSGTIEVLLTLPVADYEIVIGKFLSAWAFLSVTISGGILVPLTIWTLGDIDFGLVFSGFTGSLFLGGAYLSVGIVISSLTKDQITAFILTLLASLLLFLMGYQPILQFFGKYAGSLLSFLSLSGHFESFRMGVLDPRDIFYFLSVIIFMLYVNVYILRGRK